MSVYSSKLHRKVYEQHFGPIPKESDGRSYEIHHKYFGLANVAANPEKAKETIQGFTENPANR